MNKRQFKDFLTSTCQVSSVRRASEVSSSILTAGNILLLNFLLECKIASDVNIVSCVCL